MAPKKPSLERSCQLSEHQSDLPISPFGDRYELICTLMNGGHYRTVGDIRKGLRTLIEIAYDIGIEEALIRRIGKGSR